MTAATPGPVDSTDAIRLALRSWPEVESYLQGCKGVIIPLGSTEQHGPTGAITWPELISFWSGCALHASMTGLLL